MKCFSFSDIGILIMSDLSFCYNFPFITKHTWSIKHIEKSLCKIKKIWLECSFFYFFNVFKEFLYLLAVVSLQQHVYSFSSVKNGIFDSFSSVKNRIFDIIFFTFIPFLYTFLDFCILRLISQVLRIGINV